MGLLDEAIREHLELKRRRGADPSEVDRLEREALGPVRRSPQDPGDALIDEDSPLPGAYPDEAEIPYSLEDEADWADPRAEPAPFENGSQGATDLPPTGKWDVEPATEIAPLPAVDHEAEAAPERSSDLPRHHEIAEEWEAHERQGLIGEPAGSEPDEPAPAAPAPPTSDPPPAPEGPVYGSERQRPAAPEPLDLEQETVEHDIEADELDPPRADEPREGEDVLEETPDFLQDTPDHDRLWFEQRPPRDFDFDG